MLIIKRQKKNGILVIEMLALTEAVPKEDYNAEKAQLTLGKGARVNGITFQALKELVEIEDNRHRHY